jgi:hypothetical protein
MTWYRTPGKSLTRPPRTSTIECSCKLWPSPGMYTVASFPFESRTRAIFRKAEFGFLGVMVRTWRQTPRFWGHPSNNGDLLFRRTFFLGFRTSWLNVGMANASSMIKFQSLQSFLTQEGLNNGPGNVVNFHTPQYVGQLDGKISRYWPRSFTPGIIQGFPHLNRW